MALDRGMTELAGDAGRSATQDFGQEAYDAFATSNHDRTAGTLDRTDLWVSDLVNAGAYVTTFGFAGDVDVPSVAALFTDTTFDAESRAGAADTAGWIIVGTEVATAAVALPGVVKAIAGGVKKLAAKAAAKAG